uniref:Uncharacterized protein n=1 Tax=Anguilla anguilla TaxID=7936 RepID=A0A0E9V8A0_ANGAN
MLSLSKLQTHRVLNGSSSPIPEMSASLR